MSVSITKWALALAVAIAFAWAQVPTQVSYTQISGRPAPGTCISTASVPGQALTTWNVSCLVPPPAAPGACKVVGQFAVDSGSVYYCIAGPSGPVWGRAALATQW